MPEKGYYRCGQVLGRDSGFLVAKEFLALRRDRGSLCRDMVLRLQAVAWSRHNIFMSRQCFVSLSWQCRDKGFLVTIEMVTTRG